jgi:UDP-2-acetamido-2-deoxy-ribo-hexuluronate aminotransferase
MKIEFIDLKRQYQFQKEEIDKAIEEVITNSSFIMGKQVLELENTLAEYVGTKYAIGCGSGTDALLLALMVQNLQPGDEIITTPFTFIATSETIAFLKLKPVFVDIDPETYNINPKQIAQAITNHTKGIMAVDIFGQCADYDDINRIAKQHNLFVIEDAAQSFGAEYKGRRSCSLAEIACTSFFPAKPLGCFGDGGMIFTSDEKMSNILRSLRVHGMGNDKYDNVRIGLNARLDTLQAAIVLTKFKHFPEEINSRQSIAEYYNQNLGDLMKKPQILPHNKSVYAQYSIRLQDRDRLQKHLAKQNIPTAIHYPKPLHLQKAFSYLNYKVGNFPIAEQVAAEILSLPMHPYLTENELNVICNTIKDFH